MFDPPVELLEANLFDFSGESLRPEDRSRFASLHPGGDEVRQHGELAERMKQDAEEARRLLALPE
jgi:hypothetical protein